MVFDNDRPTSNPTRFFEEDGGIFRMVQDVNQQYNVDTIITVRNSLAVKQLDWDLCFRSQSDVDRSYLHVRT